MKNCLFWAFYIGNHQAVIKSAASAASRNPRGAHGRRLGLRTTGLGGSPGSWSLIFGLPGGCASSRLDHGLKFYGIQGGCASSRLISGFSDCQPRISKRVTSPPGYNPHFLYFFGRFSIYLAPSGAKYCEKGLAAIGKS